jgi:hypothetical protein
MPHRSFSHSIRRREIGRVYRPTLGSTDFRRPFANSPKPGRTSSVPLRSVRLERHSNSQPFGRSPGLSVGAGTRGTSLREVVGTNRIGCHGAIIWTFITLIVPNCLDDDSILALMIYYGSRVTPAHCSFVRRQIQKQVCRMLLAAVELGIVRKPDSIAGLGE